MSSARTNLIFEINLHQRRVENVWLTSPNVNFTTIPSGMIAI